MGQYHGGVSVVWAAPGFKFATHTVCPLCILASLRFFICEDRSLQGSLNVAVLYPPRVVLASVTTTNRVCLGGGPCCFAIIFWAFAWQTTPAAPALQVWSSKMSRARVYADVNVKRPREYWDYENLTITWGYVAGFLVDLVPFPP